MKENAVLKNAFYYTISSVIVMIISFISVTLFTFLLDTTEYGLINFFTSSVNMFTIILSVSISSSINRFYYNNDINYKKYVKSIISVVILINAIILPILLIFADKIALFFNIHVNLFYLILIGTLINIFLDFYERHLIASQNAKGHMFHKILPLLLNNLISILLIISLKNANGGYLRILTILIINFIYLIYLIYRFRFLLKEKTDKKIALNATLFSLPLVMHSLSNYALTYFDKFVITQYGNLSNTGIYSLATKIGEVLLLMINSLNYSWAPVFYQNKGDYKSVENLLVKYTQLVFFMALGIIFYSNSVVRLIISSEYYDALSIIPILCCGYIFVFLYQIYINYSIYQKKTINITINTVIASLVNIVLNYIFVPKYGYIAASYTTLFSYFVLFILHYINSKYILKGNVFELKKIFKECLYFIIGLIINVLTNNFIKNIIISLLIKTIYILYLMFKFNILRLIQKILFKKGGQHEET